MSQLDKLASIIDQLASIEVEANTESELTELASLARLGSRRIESIVLRIASRTAALHAQGRSGSASELLAESGHVSTGTAKREAKRAEIAESLPLLGEALAAGVMSGEHLDIVARATGCLTDEQRTHLDTVALSHAASKNASLPS